MKAALKRADKALEGFEIDLEIREALREAIALQVLEERASINNEIQYRLGNIRLSVTEDLDRVRREIETVLHPTPLL